MKRTLVLKKQTLTELATDDLRTVVGGGTHITCYTGLAVCPCTGLINDPPPIATLDTPCVTR